MNLRKYEAFANVVSTGSLTRAAEALGCTQSAVSHMINSLETELGFRLLIRNRHGVKLTADGEKALPAVLAVLDANERLEQIVQSIHGLDAGVVRIGAFTSVAVHWLPGVLRNFQADYPNVEIKLLNGDYHDVEQWLMGGEIDIGFVNVPCALGCECIALAKDRMLAVLPKDGRYENYSRFPLTECENMPFISLLESSDHDARRALDAAGVKPNVRFYTKDDYAIMAMVEQGLGMSIMPELLLRGRQDKLLTLPLVPDYSRIIGMAIAAGDKAGPATRRFADYVISFVSEDERLRHKNANTGNINR